MDPRSNKVLILHASAGHGHAKAADAVAQALGVMGHPAPNLDTAELAGPFHGDLYRNTYLWQIRQAPWMWGAFYYGLDGAALYALIAPLRRLYNSMTCRRLVRAIRDYAPETIVATHFQGIDVACSLKRRGLLSCRVIAVITDFMPHRVWIDPLVDRYCVACDATRDELVRRGVPSERVRVTGIPVGVKFARRMPREAAAAKLGVDASAFTALLTSGGAGLSTLRDILDELLRLPEKPQVIIVCGTNRPLHSYAAEISLKHPLVKALQFVDNMDEWMDVSDILIGKGGGITLSEAFAKGLPAILYRSVPGQEARNTRLAVSRGAAAEVNRPDAMARALADLIGDPQALGRMRASAAALGRPQAASDIALEALGDLP